MVAEGGEEGSGGRTVVVGVKLDKHSRELLTWALVKVAQTGDRVVALHVLDSNVIVDRDGKSSLLSLVKAFDSILEVYEGFCNLKQIDLKLKICRGSSVPKILVREANSYYATELIVGTAQTHHTIRSTASVAKYCAKKLSKDCSVLAVNNGKIVFHRESNSPSRFNAKEMEHRRRNGLLNALQRSLSKNMRVIDDGQAKPMLTWDENSCRKPERQSLERNCSICSPDSSSPVKSCVGSSDERSSNGDVDDESSMAMVPVQKLEAASSSVTLLLKEMPEIKPGWPLLRRAIVSNNNAASCNSPVRQVSVVQWAMRLPSRYAMSIENSSSNESSDLDGERGAIVAVENTCAAIPRSPDFNAGFLPKELEDLHQKYSATCRLFAFQELRSATVNFKPGNMIGKGGSSQVYRGRLPDGKEIAAKILKPSEDALKEFLLEIEIITDLHHKNIISLFGFCFDENRLILVYDFITKGSLEENLHGNNNNNKKEPLAFGWSERYKVAIGVADALDYLHSRETQPVIHRDVKSSNILLSDDFEPQLSDFGLAKWASATSTHITCSDVAGTFGYLAPEYFMYGKVNEKIDIYAYGVVLLELLSGRKPISSNCPKGQESLVMWARPILNSEKFTRLLDPKLGSSYDPEQVERMALAALLCIRRAPRARPQMSLIVKLLQGEAETVKWARLQVSTAAAAAASVMPEIRQGATNSFEGLDALDDEVLAQSHLQSHLNLAMLGVEEDSVSSSIEHSLSLEDYLRGRWSRSSSFD